MKHKRKGERKAAILNYKLHGEGNVNFHTSPYLVQAWISDVFSFNAGESDLQLEHFWDCQKKLLCFKECFSFHLLTVCPQFVGRDNVL